MRKYHVAFICNELLNQKYKFPFGTSSCVGDVFGEHLYVLTLWNMYVISSKWIPADFTGGDDVATWMYKSTCGEGSGSFCCSVSALCVYVLFTVVCPLYIENILWQLARNKILKRSVLDCVPLLARVSSRVVTHIICALLVWERSCPHCLRMSMRTLRSRRVLFEEGALSSAPRGSSPTLAEAERRLKS